MANHDALTNVLNRREFEHQVESILGKQSSPIGSTMFLLDIDDFKLINDRYGHASGDLALKHVVNIIRKVLPIHALLCRLIRVSPVSNNPSTSWNS